MVNRTIYSRFKAQVDRQPEALAIAEDGNSVTYAELDSLVDEILDYRKHITDGTHIAYVATLDGEDVGCGAICLSDELPSPDNPSGRCAYLMNIYVREPYRNKGVGHAIVSTLLEEAKACQCRKIYLETTDAGRSVYESLGFTALPDMMKYTKQNN